MKNIFGAARLSARRCKMARKHFNETDRAARIVALRYSDIWPVVG
jgi:hypothetical protein